MTCTLPRVLNTDPPVTLPDGLRLVPLFQRHTREGVAWFREARIPLWMDRDFKPLWKARKLGFLQRGYSLKQDNGAWILQQWLAGQPGAHTLTPIGADKVRQAMNPPLALPAEAPLLELDLPPLPGGLEDFLYDYQRQPARQLYRALMNGKSEWGYAGALDLSYGGTGKTYMDIAAALAVGKRIVVLCPSVGKEGWLRAFAHFGAEPHFVGTYEAVRGAYRPGIAARDERGKFRWENEDRILVIFDEAQALRHDDTLTVECCSAAIRQGIPVICASATLAVSITELRFAGRIVGLHAGASDWERFLMDHGCSRKSKTAPWKSDNKAHHLQRVHAKLFPSRGCRVRLEDLGDKCPHTTLRVLPLHVPEAVTIETAWREALVSLDKMRQQGMHTGRVAMLERVARMKVWEKSENALVPEVARRARQFVKDGKSVALFMNFNASRLNMCRELRTNAGFYGGQAPARRKYWEDQFQSDREHILVSNIVAGGASVSLHDVRGDRPRVSFIFPTDNVVVMEQATFRVSRVGEQGRSEQFIVCVNGTMSEKMVQRTRQKMFRIATLNDGHGAVRRRF